MQPDGAPSDGERPRPLFLNSHHHLIANENMTHEALCQDKLLLQKTENPFRCGAHPSPTVTSIVDSYDFSPPATELAQLFFRTYSKVRSI
jgi:hypothetical protein